MVGLAHRQILPRVDGHVPAALQYANFCFLGDFICPEAGDGWNCTDLIGPGLPLDPRWRCQPQSGCQWTRQRNQMPWLAVSPRNHKVPVCIFLVSAPLSDYSNFPLENDRFLCFGRKVISGLCSTEIDLTTITHSVQCPLSAKVKYFN